MEGRTTTTLFAVLVVLTSGWRRDLVQRIFAVWSVLQLRDSVGVPETAIRPIALARSTSARSPASELPIFPH